MRSIWKFPLAIVDFQEIEMPQGAKPLLVAVQPSVANRGLGTLCIWAEVDTDVPKIKRGVWIVGTGHPMLLVADAAKHIGSTLMVGQTFLDGPGFVWHVYMNEEPK